MSYRRHQYKEENGGVSVNSKRNIIVTGVNFGKQPEKFRLPELFILLNFPY